MNGKLNRYISRIHTSDPLFYFFSNRKIVVNSFHFIGKGESGIFFFIRNTLQKKPNLCFTSAVLKNLKLLSQHLFTQKILD
jgi:hypothetical protein